MAFFNLTRSAEGSAATVTFTDGSVQVITDKDKNFEAVKAGLVDNSLSDDELLNLIAPFEAIYRKLTRLSERVSRKGSKLLFDGDVTHNSLTEFIIDIMNEGDEQGWKAYVAFLEKLYTNPSEQSREHLFHFITANGLQVTPEGDIVLYKGTRMDGRSTKAGYGIVNGVEYESAYLLNELGSIVEIPRSMVDGDRNSKCSVGLHVGAFEYVTGEYYSTWPRVWTVIVNPRDVVAVPHDFKSSKIRVTRYKIVEDNTTKVKHTGRVWTPPAQEAPVVEVAEVPAEETAPVEPEVTPLKKGIVPIGGRVAEYEKIISDLIAFDPNTNLKRYRSKKITAGRRDEFTQAANNLGYKL